MADTDVDLVKQAKNILPVGNGGTGAASHTINTLLIGNGSAALGEIAPGSNGDVLQVVGGVWTSQPANTGIQRTFSFFMG